MRKQSAGVSVFGVPSSDLSQNKETYVSGPYTQEFLASFLAAKQAGKKVSHPEDHLFPDLLHDSIHRFVEKMCNRYLNTYGSETEDIIQDCMITIFRRIHKYDSARGRFTTWSGWVCISVLNTKYRRKLVNDARILVSDKVLREMIAEDTMPSPIAMDIADAVTDLAKKHPKRRRLIFEMFGNPKTVGLYFPTKINVAQAARAVGEDTSSAYYFYSKVVRPFFQRRFE